MAITDVRSTAIDVVNEVRRKLKLTPVTSFTSDSYANVMLTYLNDTISEISDYGNWQETLVEVNVTAQSSVADYSIPTSAVNVVQNVHEIVFNNQIGEMRKVNLDTIRRLSRIGSYGAPQQWGVVGTDANGNPVIRVYPTPSTNEDGQLFNMLVYSKPAILVTADTSTLLPFAADLVTQGLLCRMVLDESDGEPTQRYQMFKEDFDNNLNETYNRFNGDSGSTVYFRPARGRR
jgi:hypothetical protein